MSSRRISSPRRSSWRCDRARASRDDGQRKIPAAIARAAHQPSSLEEADIDDPRADELLVKIHGVGLCHTDLVARDQFIPIPLPAVLGHEGAGTVVAVGSRVSKL